jgi:PAS domain S-box-containing protein
VTDEDAREAAEAKADRLSLALAAAQAGVFEINYADQTWWLSPELIAILGRELTREEVFGEVWPIYHPEDADKVRSIILEAQLETPEIVTFEARVETPSGETRWTEWRMQARFDAEGRFFACVGMVLDIERRKRAEAEVTDARRESQEVADRLKLAMSSARAGAFQIDVAARSFWCSPEFEAIAGRKLEFHEAASPAWALCHPDDVERVEATIRAKRGTTEPVEWRLVRPDGACIWVATNGHTYVNAQGVVDKVVGLIIDIDDKKRQELALIEAERAAQAAGEAKAQFLANMSHEIRTPMNGVLGILGLLQNEPLSGEGRSMLVQAEACGRMLAQILDDVIDLSKIDAGRLELSPEPTDVTRILEGVVELLRPQAEAKGLTLSMRVAGLDGWAVVDPVRIRQALFNLIGNAIKFTAEGFVEARLFIGEEAGGKRLRFEIEDSGVGIPEDAQARLFQRFQQADGSTARQFGGSGLGLVITRALADMMQGEVGFSSREGRGSTFWLDAPAPSAEPTDESAFESLPSLEGLDILLVEDNPVNRLVATKILEGFGAQVTTAEDGVLGVEAAQSHVFDLVLMDVQMPRMDGVEATRRIRALPAVGGLPIVGLTANVMLHQWKAYREAGMDGVAAKPISPRALLTEIGRVLNEKARAAA